MAGVSQQFASGEMRDYYTVFSDVHLVDQDAGGGWRIDYRRVAWETGRIGPEKQLCSFSSSNRHD